MLVDWSYSKLAVFRGGASDQVSTVRSIVRASGGNHNCMVRLESPLELWAGMDTTATQHHQIC
jgi:hypothetical protein